MKRKDQLLALVEFIAWCAMTYAILYSVKNDVNLYVSSVIIVVLLYVASISCPIVRHLQAWKDLMREK